MNLVKSRPN